MKNIEIESITQLLYDNVKKLIASGKLEGKEIVVFGANKPAMAVVEILDKEGISIKGIVDNNQQKREMIALGLMEPINGHYKLYAPQELLGTVSDDVYILIASKCYHDMCVQIGEMGFDTEKQTKQLLEFSLSSEDDGKKEKMIDIEEMKRIQLGLLKHFHEICEKKGLRHYLCGGSMLGAVRHKGYIPWDDDIDVFMPVPDYLEFIKGFEETEEYALQNMDTCMTPFMFTRLVQKNTVLEEVNYPYRSRTGINIDIFPISGFPSDPEEVNLFTKELIQGRNDWDDFWFRYDGSKEQETEYTKLRDGVMERMTRYNFDKSEDVGYIVTGKLDRELMARKCFDEETTLLFEGEEYPVPIGYETYLLNMYGDYMKLPPKEQQISRHEFKAWYE